MLSLHAKIDFGLFFVQELCHCALQYALLFRSRHLFLIVNQHASDKCIRKLLFLFAILRLLLFDKRLGPIRLSYCLLKWAVALLAFWRNF